MDILEKAEFLASPWALTDKAFKGFSFSLIILNLGDALGNINRTFLSFIRSSQCNFFF